MSAAILPKWPMQTGAKCETCPLMDQPAVPCEPASVGKPRVFIVGEGPGRVEVAKGRPFVGETGAFLNDILTWVGLPRDTVHISNATLCLPKKHMTAKEWTSTVESCQPRLAAEVNDCPDGSLILAMGQKVIQSMTGKNSVGAWRGYPLPGVGPFEELGKRAIIFPTYHPAFIFRAPAYLPIIKMDIHRALMMLIKKVKYPYEWPDLHIHENEGMHAALDRMMKADWVGADIESAGEDPYTSPLLCTGLGVAEGDGEREEAVSVIHGLSEAHEKVKWILKNKRIRKVFQNGNFDLIGLASWRMECSGNDFDTLVAHRVLAPNVAHDLGFIASCEFATPRWKSLFKVGDDRKGGSIFAKAAKDPTKFEALRLYNAKDALMTAKLRRPMLERLIKQGGPL